MAALDPIADIPNVGQPPTMIAALLLLAAAHISAPACDLRSVQTARATHDALGRRAAMIVARASSADDMRMSAFVDPSASFDLGAGDVGRPLGQGVAGVRALAAMMKADQFRFLGWDYMDSPADACGKRSITVEFIDTTDRLVSQVEFAFDRGRVVKAKGWQRSFEAGSLSSLRRGGNGSKPPRSGRFKPDRRDAAT